jgi:hypothetical protein
MAKNGRTRPALARNQTTKGIETHTNPIPLATLAPNLAPLSAARNVVDHRVRGITLLDCDSVMRRPERITHPPTGIRKVESIIERTTN